MTDLELRYIRELASFDRVELLRSMGAARHMYQPDHARLKQLAQQIEVNTSVMAYLDAQIARAA